MTYLLLLALVSVICNGAIWAMFRAGRLPEHIVPAAPVVMAAAPDMTFDWEGLV